jgi:hypothetical protein
MLNALNLKNPRSLMDLPRGVIVATCRLIDCLEIYKGYRRFGGYLPHDIPCNKLQMSDYVDYEVPPAKDTPEYLFGDYTPGRYAWILSDIKPLDKPIPAKGKQGLWNWEASPCAL